MPERKTILITVASVVVITLVVLGVFMVKQKGEVSGEEHSLTETPKIEEIDIGTIKNMSPEMNTAFYGRE